MNGLNIIIVEDEVKSREGIVKLISGISKEYKVVAQADNGFDGLEYIERLKPDLIICDIRMPGMDGLEMIYQLQRKGIYIKTIIITGYAEFDYAKKGINLGVEDYLLKPITCDDMKEILEKIKRKLDDEDKEKMGEEYVQNRIFESLLLGNRLEEIQMQMLSSNSLFVDDNGCTALSLIYTGDIGVGLNEKAEKAISNYLKDMENLQYYAARLDSFNGIAFLTSYNEDFSIVADGIEYELLPQLEVLIGKPVVFGWTSVRNVKSLNHKFQEVKENLKWALTLGCNKTITSEKLSDIKVKELKYPYEIEKIILTDIKNNDIDGLYKSIEKFLSHYKAEYYSPNQIIEIFHRLTFVILNLIKEINYNMFKFISKKDILQSIKTSVTRDELEENLCDLIKDIEEFYTDRHNEPTYSLLVKKVINIIEEDYAQKIQLCEIADQLNVTQEYLSYLFNKEVGENFSVFLKKHRVQKAKELLLESDLKIYEIAEKVGYSDVKYFCRVFKEITGFPTMEYIKVYHR